MGSQQGELSCCRSATAAAPLPLRLLALQTGSLAPRPARSLPALPRRPQTRFRSMWERYCRGVQAIVFVVDSADLDSLEAAKEELHSLLTKPSLVRAGTGVQGGSGCLHMAGRERRAAPARKEVHELQPVPRAPLPSLARAGWHSPAGAGK